MGTRSTTVVGSIDRAIHSVGGVCQPDNWSIGLRPGHGVRVTGRTAGAGEVGGFVVTDSVAEAVEPIDDVVRGAASVAR